MGFEPSENYLFVNLRLRSTFVAQALSYIGILCKVPPATLARKLRLASAPKLAATSIRHVSQHVLKLNLIWISDLCARDTQP